MAIYSHGWVTALQPGDPDDGDEGRRNRGRAIAALATIEKRRLGYRVPSQSGNHCYIVSLDDEVFCSCPDFEQRAAPCKHIYAAIYVSQGQVAACGGLAETKALSVTYKRNWPKYHSAKVNEPYYFPILLRGLCDLVEPEQPQRMGRPRLAESDIIFSLVMKAYMDQPGRQMQGWLQHYGFTDFLDKVPSYNSCYRYMANENLTPVLEHLITLSALPMRALESNFSIDSSGFSTGVYHKWFDRKHGRQVRREKWVTAHAVCGNFTKVVTAAAVTPPYVQDSPMLKPLLEITTDHFDVRNFAADKAYLSVENLWAIHEKGAMPLIPFKTNSVVRKGSDPKTLVWNQSLYYYHLHRDWFNENYHRRSISETVFEMVKDRFDEGLRSKVPVALTNEVLVKLIAHNICTLILVSYMGNVDPLFSKGNIYNPTLPTSSDMEPTELPELPTPHLYTN